MTHDPKPPSRTPERNSSSPAVPARGSDAVAALDVGTNTALLLVARLDTSGRLDVVEDLCEAPRLGEGVAATGRLSAAARARASATLARFAARIRAHSIPPERVRAVGTAVFRRAADARAFVDEVARATGLALEIVSPEEEARLGAVAVEGEGVTRSALVIDVGGGSTEIACAELDLRRSVPIGAVVLTETFVPDPASGARALAPGGFAALQASARSAVEAFPAGVARGRDVVALGGTGVNLACLAGGFARFDHERAEGARVPARAAREWAERLAALDLDARRAHPLEADRAWILPAGLSALAATLERVGAEDMRVTGRGLRFGVARDLLARL